MKEFKIYYQFDCDVYVKTINASTREDALSEVKKDIPSYAEVVLVA